MNDEAARQREADEKQAQTPNKPESRKVPETVMLQGREVPVN